MRFKAQIDQSGMSSIIIMLLSLNARIRKMGDMGVQPGFSGLFDDHLGQFEQRELLGYLVKDAIFTFLWWRSDSQLDAANSISQVDVTTRLFPLAVNRQRIT